MRIFLVGKIQLYLHQLPFPLKKKKIPLVNLRPIEGKVFITPKWGKLFHSWVGPVTLLGAPFPAPQLISPSNMDR